jgi:HNH endonuclease
MPDKKQIVNSIAAIARKLGRAPSRAEFISRSGISPFFVLQWFRSWSDAVRTAGLRPCTLNKRVGDRALLEDWGNTVRKNRGLLPRHIYRRKGKYNPCTLAKRFSGWSSVPQAFRKFAKGKREWRDVVALLPTPVPEEKRERPKEDAAPPILPNHSRNRWGRAEARPYKSSQRLTLSTNIRYKTLKDRATYGNPIDFRGLRHEPVNEQGVVLLFGMVAKELGYLVESVQKGFPDCEAKRQIGPDRWQRVNIEFEFESRNFRDHGHPVDGCDVIVCWRHNWAECPKQIEVVELSNVIQSLANAGE